MAATRRHLFHVLPESPWPFFIGVGVFFLLSSLAFAMHGVAFTVRPFIAAMIVLSVTAAKWLDDIIDEATCAGDHTIAVQMGLTSGFLLFILTEIMLFIGFFWAFFNASLCPTIVIGAEFPPIGVTVIPIYLFPLYNTCLLLLSGITVTWLHKAVMLGSYKESIDSFILTIFLGLCFFVLQMFEYYESPFSYNTSVYGCSFFMLTGLHGLHVFVGIVCLFLSFLRLLKNHYTVTHHNGLVFAIWYWHFVDVVWLILFITVYFWGSNIAH